MKKYSVFKLNFKEIHYICFKIINKIISYARYFIFIWIIFIMKIKQLILLLYRIFNFFLPTSVVFQFGNTLIKKWINTYSNITFCKYINQRMNKFVYRHNFLLVGTVNYLSKVNNWLFPDDNYTYFMIRQLHKKKKICLTKYIIVLFVFKRST